MVESPLIQEIRAEVKHEDILAFLEGRFGPIPAEVATALRAIYDIPKLKDLVNFVPVCPDLEAFRARLQT